MLRVWTIVRRVIAAERGEDLLEYAMLAALIAVVAVTGVAAVGQTIHNALWVTIVNNF